MGGQVLVPLQNFRRDDVKLDGGTELGCVELFGCDVGMSSQGVGPCGQVVESDGIVESDGGVESDGVAPVSGFEGSCSAQSESKGGGLSSQVLAVSDSSRGRRLLDQLALPREGLGQCESQQLDELLCKAGDVFALDD